MPKAPTSWNETLMLTVALSLLSCGGNTATPSSTETPEPSTPSETVSTSPSTSPSTTPTSSQTPTVPSDADADGFPEGMDCDDMDPERFPGADEGNCNGVDNDCDDRLDEDVGYRIIYCDGDGDDYGDPLPLLVQCGDDGCEGYPVDNGDDCNDDDPLINPDMPDDDCDDEDENCSGYADEQAPPLYVDTDQDGYGNPDLAIRCVDMQVGLSDNGLDCNDQEASIRPRTEDEEDFDGCDELDNDCDAFIDEDEPKPTFWPDFDGDGYGTDDSDDYTPLESCTTPPPVEGFNWVPLKNDCDEEDPDISPGATELCDTDVDEDCDTDIDESFCL